MKTLEKDELYRNLQGFLKTKGVDLQEGSYAQKIQKSCQLLSEAINTGQQGLARAKNEVDKKLDQLRQVIHEKTAPRGSSTSTPSNPPNEAAPKTTRQKSKSPKRATRRKST
jgi:hypothetical protein